MQKITIAIDGFSSTGKSTIAKRLASDLGYVYVDTGAMYRATTLYAMRHNYMDDDRFDQEGFVQALDKIRLTFKYNTDLGLR